MKKILICFLFVLITTMSAAACSPSIQQSTMAPTQPPAAESPKISEESLLSNKDNDTIVAAEGSMSDESYVKDLADLESRSAIIMLATVTDIRLVYTVEPDFDQQISP